MELHEFHPGRAWKHEFWREIIVSFITILDTEIDYWTV